MTASPVPNSLPRSTQAVFALFAELVADPERMAAALDALDQHTAHLAAQTRALLPLIPELNPKRKTKPKPRTKPKHSPRPPFHLARASATICAIVRQSLARARFASMLFRVEKAEGVEHGARNLGTFAAAAAQLA